MVWFVQLVEAGKSQGNRWAGIASQVRLSKRLAADCVPETAIENQYHKVTVASWDYQWVWITSGSGKAIFQAGHETALGSQELLAGC